MKDRAAAILRSAGFLRIAVFALVAGTVMFLGALAWG